MLLSSTSDLVRVVTDAAAAIEVHAGWADWTTGPAVALGRTNTSITTATTTTVVASPASSTVRQVKNLLIRNDHASTSCGIKVFHTDGTTQVDIFQALLPAGWSAVYDGSSWKVHDAQGREVRYTVADPATFNEYMLRADADRTLTSTTSEQQMFNPPTNGRLTLPLGVYLFDWRAIITGMSGTSGNARLDILGAGSAVLADIVWSVEGLDNTTVDTIADDDSAHYQVDTTAASVVAAGTGTALRFKASGTFEVGTAGTLQPALALVTAAAAVVQNGSFFRALRMGDVGLTALGTSD